MAPIDLNLLRSFAALYESGSFTGAARQLGVPRSTVSRAIAALEEQLGEELVHRTTRTVVISDEGKELFDRVSPALAAIGTALADRPTQQEVSGIVRLTATPDVSAALLAEAATRFTVRYPQTQVEIIATTDVKHLTRDGIDLALRIVNARLPDSTALSQRIGTIRWQVYAAPSYLARRGTPRSERDLQDRDWVGFRGVTSVPSTKIPGRRFSEGRIIVDDVFVAREILRRGGGVGGLPSFLIAEDLQAGLLVPLLPKLVLINADVYLLQPARKHTAPRVAAFKQLLMEVLRQRPLA
ncbi:MAG TPA: LysR family transcriptional regulator [Kofleriaceae bacterium]|jgi:DNA-binding transcriptional LysR family regulator